MSRSQGDIHTKFTWQNRTSQDSFTRHSRCRKPQQTPQDCGVTTESTYICQESRADPQPNLDLQ